MKAARFYGGAAMLLLFAISPIAFAADEQPDPSFLHGLGKVIDGVVLEFPKTVLEGTLAGPPVVGTVLAALGGLASAGQKTISGLMEMSAGFDPWGTKRKR